LKYSQLCEDRAKDNDTIQHQVAESFLGRAEGDTHSLPRTFMTGLIMNMMHVACMVSFTPAGGFFIALTCHKARTKTHINQNRGQTIL
jgi:hypothetical protein